MNKTMTLVFRVALIAMALSTSAFPQVIYNSIPSPLPPNVNSASFEGNATDEFGDRIVFSTGSGRKLVSATQTMSSWGCESGHWYSHDCVTTPGTTFNHPITLNIYNVGVGNVPGTQIASVTQTFNIPYRPSVDLVHCVTGTDDDGHWFDGTTCWNGLAVNITFDLTAANITVPNQVIYSIAFNTSTSGNLPMGVATSCYFSPGGCGYDALNVGLDGLTSVGTNFDPSDVWWDYRYPASPYGYCDGGTNGVDIFRRDFSTVGCNWTGYQPAVRFVASNVPANANDCKNGGWQTRTRADGSTFRNQGDCIQYVNTGR